MSLTSTVAVIGIATNLIANSANSNINIFKVEEYEIHKHLNDSIQTADDILPDNFFKLKTIEIEVRGLVSDYTKVNDKDYFSFYLEYDSDVVFETSVSFFEKTSFKLLKLSYQDYPNNNNLYYEEVDNFNDKKAMPIVNKLKAGTYFLLVEKKSPISNITDYINYWFRLSIQKQISNETYSLSKIMYTKQTNGVIRINDVIHSNVLDFASFMNANIRIDYENDKLMNAYLKNYQNIEIEAARLYLWDNEIIKELYNLYSILLNETNKRIEGYDTNQMVVLETLKIKNQIDSILITIILSLNGVSLPIELLVNAVSSLQQEAITFFVSAIFNRVTKPLKETLETLNLVCGQLKNYMIVNEVKPSYDSFSYVAEIVLCCKYDFNGVEYYFKNTENKIINLLNSDKENKLNNIDFTNSLNHGKLYSLDGMFPIAVVDKGVKITDIPYKIDEINKTYLNFSTSVGYYKEHYAWISFTALESKKYHFCIHTNGNEKINTSFYLNVDLFTEYCPGYLYYNWISTKSGGFKSSINDSMGCYFVKELKANETIFLRINTNNFSGYAKSLNVYVSDSKPYYLVHEHNYKNFKWINDKQHIAMCDCGENILQAHIVKNPINSFSKSNCLLCGGLVSTGLIINNSKIYKVPILNSSYKINDIYVLSNEDYEIFKKGEVQLC